MQTRSMWWTVRPWWKRVLPWWWSALLATGPAIRIATGRSRGWWLVGEVALLVLAAAFVVIDVRRLRRSREVE